ncbi:MAG: hypothetical protein WA003_05925 [Desulfuromonadaceae bacterium]
MLLREKELDHIETVSDLRAALADVPDDMDIQDALGAGLYLAVRQDGPGEKQYIEYR